MNAIVNNKTALEILDDQGYVVLVIGELKSGEGVVLFTDSLVELKQALKHKGVTPDALYHSPFFHLYRQPVDEVGGPSAGDLVLTNIWQSGVPTGKAIGKTFRKGMLAAIEIDEKTDGKGHSREREVGGCDA